MKSFKEFSQDTELNQQYTPEGVEHDTTSCKVSSNEKTKSKN